MHKIGVISDTHGMLRWEVEETLRGCEAILHGGDINSPEILSALRRIAPTYAVRGNNDFEPDAPITAVIAPEGVRMYLTHGHRDRVCWSDSGLVAAHAAEQGCALALYGHSHLCNDIVEQGVRVMNPGSISLPRSGRGSCILMEIENGQILSAVFLDTEGAPYPHDTAPKKKKRFGWF